MKKTNILVVDDEKNIRLTLHTCLENEGYLVYTAEDGEEALKTVRASGVGFDIVFLDMKMPGMDGITVLRKLKEIHSEVQVVMMTAYGTVETAVEAMKLGAIDFLQKPFTPDRIQELAALLIKRQRLDRSALADYESIVEFAKGCITKKDFATAKELLQRAVAKNPGLPEAFNLLGVMLEMDEEVLEAQKMYRAALALDPSFNPANENLHRSVNWDYTAKGINLGENKE